MINRFEVGGERLIKKSVRPLSLLIILVFFIVGCDQQKNWMFPGKNLKHKSVNIYLIDKDASRLESVKRKIYYSSQNDLYAKILDSLLKPSESNQMRSILADNVKVKINQEKAALYISLSKEFLELNDSQRILSVYSLVKTYASLEGIRYIKFNIENPAEIENVEFTLSTNQIINFNQIEMNPKKIKKITLYFVDKKGYLVPEERVVTVNDKEFAKAIIDELIKGPETKDHFATLTQDTKLSQNIDIQNKICFVSFTKDFLKGIPNRTQQRAAIYSIVNSLTTSLDGVDKVQFLIQGQQVKKYGTIYDFNVPFEKNESLIQSEVSSD